MIRWVSVIALLVTLQIGLFGANAAAATPTTPTQGATVASAEFAIPDALASTGAQCLRGAAACFGYGSENCCGEMAVLGTIAAASAPVNWWAVAIAVAFEYAYCI